MGEYPRIESWARGFDTREEAELAARSSARGTDGNGRLLPQIQRTLDEVFGPGSKITNEDRLALESDIRIERAMAGQIEGKNKWETRERERVRTELSEVVEDLRARLLSEGLKPAVEYLRGVDQTRAILAARVKEAAKRGGRERTRVVTEALQELGFVSLPSGSRVKVSKVGLVYYFRRGHAGRSKSPR